MKKVKKRINFKKIIVIICIILAVLTVLQMFVLGWFGGIGPLKKLKDLRIGRMTGNKDIYGFSALTPRKDSPFQGKNMIILGSSVANGSFSHNRAVGEYLAKRFDANLIKEAVDGTTLTDKGKKSYVQRMLNNLDTNEECALFICQLSTNDAAQKLPLGSVTESRTPEDFDTETITGAMEYIISYVSEKWNCPIVFFTGSYYESAEYNAMVKNLNSLKKKWGICVADLWTDENFNDITKEQRVLYMADKIHPTKAGYRDWWGPQIEDSILDYLESRAETQK